MTATTGHRPATRSDAQLLRFALRADATLCGGVGLFVAMAADALSRLSGLPATAEWVAGAALVGYGALLYGAAGLGDIRLVGVSVLIGNAAVSLAAVVVLAADVLPLTAFGVASTAGFTAATVGLVVLQYLGLRRLA